MWLYLRNSIDSTLWAFEVEDSTPASEYFLFKDLNIPEGMPDGEYEYTLMMENIIVSRGLFRLGDYRNTAKSYESTVKTKQYRY